MDLLFFWFKRLCGMWNYGHMGNLGMYITNGIMMDMDALSL